MKNNMTKFGMEMKNWELGMEMENWELGMEMDNKSETTT